jgi:hypothetical protein
MNHNQLLGVNSNASAGEIQAAFRKAALEVHPDHSNSPEAAEAFIRIKEARDAMLARADHQRPRDSVQASTAAAVKATTHAAYTPHATTSIYDQFTPEEIIKIQELDELAAKYSKTSLFRRVSESVAVKRHRKKIQTNNNRIVGKY